MIKQYNGIHNMTQYKSERDVMLYYVITGICNFTYNAFNMHVALERRQRCGLEQSCTE